MLKDLIHLKLVADMILCKFNARNVIGYCWKLIRIV